MLKPGASVGGGSASLFLCESEARVFASTADGLIGNFGLCVCVGVRFVFEFCFAFIFWTMSFTCLKLSVCCGLPLPADVVGVVCFFAIGTLCLPRPAAVQSRRMRVCGGVGADTPGARR